MLQSANQFRVRRGDFDKRPFVVVADCSAEQARDFRRRYGLRGPVIADSDGSVGLLLGVRRTPYASLIDGRGIVRMKGVVNHADQLEALCLRRGKAIGSLVWDVQTQSQDGGGESGAARSTGREYSGAGASSGAG